MKKIIPILLIVLVLISIVFSWKYYEQKKENEEIKKYLVNAIYTIDRDNRSLYRLLINLSEGRNEEDLRRINNLENLYKAGTPLDSTLITSNLNELFRERLEINDSLFNYIRSGTGPSIKWDNYGYYFYFEHKPLYQIDDTIIHIFKLFPIINNPPYFINNDLSIIDYDFKKYGTHTDYSIKYEIPAKNFINDNEKNKDVQFRYKVIFKIK